MLSNYDKAPSCKIIEELNQKKNAFFDVGYTSVSCSQIVDGQYEFYHPLETRWMLQNLKQAKSLAQSAEVTDPVHAAIAKVEKSLETVGAEIKETMAQADLQKVYVSTCLLGDEPTGPSVKELLCK